MTAISVKQAASFAGAILLASASVILLTHSSGGSKGHNATLTGSSATAPATAAPEATPTPTPTTAYQWSSREFAETPDSGTTARHTAMDALAFYKANAGPTDNGGASPSLHFWLYTNTKAQIARVPAWVIQWDDIPASSTDAAPGVAPCLHLYVYNDATGKGLIDSVRCGTPPAS